jgi:hypothetical protein
MRWLSRCLRRPRPGSVVATLALFLALGGGALAFSGSGTLQKANEIGIAVGTTGDDAEVIRTVAGTANIEAYCNGGTVNLGTKNTSGKTQMRSRRFSNEFDVVGPDPNNTERFEPYSADELVVFHFSPGNGSKAPQASVTVSIDHTGNCATSRVAVINVSTVG